MKLDVDVQQQVGISVDCSSFQVEQRARAGGTTTLERCQYSTRLA